MSEIISKPNTAEKHDLDLLHTHDTFQRTLCKQFQGEEWSKGVSRFLLQAAPLGSKLVNPTRRQVPRIQ